VRSAGSPPVAGGAVRGELVFRVLLVIPILAALISAVAAAHRYLIQRLVLDAALPPMATKALVALILLLAASVLLEPFAERLLRPRQARILAWPASLWMGLFFYLSVLLGLSEGALALAGPWLPMAEGLDSETAVALGRWRAAGAVTVALALTGTATRLAMRPPRLRRLEIALARWPASLDGLRIVRICDLHIGPILGRRFARHVVDRIEALDPDLVVVTGDLVDGSVSKLADEVAPFAELSARHGVFFVPGNHDYFSGVRGWCEHVESLGIRVLRNERVSIRVPSERSDSVFELAGVDDHRAGLIPGQKGEDLEAALRALPPDRPVLLLAHDPTTFKRASTMGIDLQLSGHTHGGQIWPFHYLVRLAVRFLAGLYRRGDATLFVSRGTGFWGPPMRLFAPAEITEIALRSGAEPSVLDAGEGGAGSAVSGE
jgi:predicted MPP superfamily phosphohydrolase